MEANAFYGNDPTGTISYNISCNGLSDGAAIVNIGGGTAHTLTVGLQEVMAS